MKGGDCGGCELAAAGRRAFIKDMALAAVGLLAVSAVDPVSLLAESVREPHALCTGVTDKKKQHLTVKGAGHYGIFSGRRWREVVYPQVKGFIRKHA